MDNQQKEHNLEYCIKISKKYESNLKNVVDTHAQYFQHLLDNFPDMSKKWYHEETERRTKQHFKEEYMRSK